MQDTLIHRTESAFAYPLLIKPILEAPLVDAPDQEIVYRDLLRLTYRSSASGSTGSPAPSRALGVQARRHRRDPRLGQPPLPGVLLRRADDRRRPAHGQRAPHPRADPVHDQPRRGRRDPRAHGTSCRSSRQIKGRIDTVRALRAADRRRRRPPAASMPFRRRVRGAARRSRRRASTSRTSTRTPGRPPSTPPAPPACPRASTSATASSSSTRSGDGRASAPPARRGASTARTSTCR